MTDSLRLTRMRMYAMIDSIEHDMRAMLNRFVLVDLEADKALGEFVDKTLDRKSKDALAAEDSSLLEYLDFRDSHILLLRHRGMLPSDLAKEIRETTVLVESLVATRNRVMHGRPLADTDARTTESISQQLETTYWRQLHDTTEVLRNDPWWEPYEAPSPTDFGISLHNLPPADYDETGLVGRGQDVHKLLEMIRRKRENVITITGEGGVGKTALALEIAYRLVDDPSRPFDAVLWTSLKTERLTPQGIQPIHNAVRSMLGATSEISSALSGDAFDSFLALGEALEEVNALLIIDNLETVNSASFMEFYEAMPSTVKILVTSRVGVGEVERRYPLSGLQHRDACALLSDLARTRSVNSLIRIRPDTRDEIVKRLRLSPLAIRWFVLAVESGRDPLELLRDQSELLQFCIKSVHDSLSDEGQRALQCLLALGRPATSDELVLLTGGEVDDISRAVKELTRGSLVRLDAPRDPNGSFTVCISESAGQYLRATQVFESDYVAEISRRDEEFRLDEERRNSAVRERLLAPSVVRVRRSSDAATAQLLRQALSASQDGDYPTAYQLVTKARALNADFWEVDRVDAFLRASEGDYHTASQIYMRAYRLAEAENRGVVAHFMAGNYSRNLKDLDSARRFAQEAHDLIGTPETASALGNILVWVREFDQGIALIEPTIKELSGKARLIHATSLISAYRRKAEYLAAEERSPIAALESALRGLSTALSFLRAGTTDHRLVDAAAECLKEALDATLGAVSHGIDWPGQIAELITVAPYARRLLTGRQGPYISASIQRLASFPNLPPELAHLHEMAMGLAEISQTRDCPLPAPRGDTSLVGRVHSLLGGYGFLIHQDYPDNVFFHHSACRDLSFGELYEGEAVEFGVCYQDGRLRAAFVRPVTTT